MMKDSKVSPQWLAAMMAANPVRSIGEGNFQTGPVRLSFTNLFTPQKNDENPTAPPKYNTVMLWPLGADLALLGNEVNRLIDSGFPGTPRDAQGKPFGLHVPFHDQAEKAMKYAGYTPGATHAAAGTQYKPMIVDSKGNPIVSEDRVYPGVWAICCINAYVFRNPKKKGVSFGLQSVMIVQDDEKLGGGAIDPRAAFTGVSITSDVSVASQFGVVPSTTVAPQTYMQAAPAADDGSDLY